MLKSHCSDFRINTAIEPPHDKTNKMACAPSKDSGQPGHPSSLIRVFAVRMKKNWVLSYTLSAQPRLWSDWAHAQADLSLCWAHSHFVGFVMRRSIVFFFECLSCSDVYGIVKSNPFNSNLFTPPASVLWVSASLSLEAVTSESSEESSSFSYCSRRSSRKLEMNMKRVL